MTQEIRIEVLREESAESLVHFFPRISYRGAESFAFLKSRTRVLNFGFSLPLAHGRGSVNQGWTLDFGAFEGSADGCVHHLLGQAVRDFVEVLDLGADDVVVFRVIGELQAIYSVCYGLALGVG